MSMKHSHRIDNETGAIMPMFGLLIVVLLVFSAFAVDFGAAWAERRQLQSAADAGAMAGVLPPLAIGDNIATAAMDFVDNNVATPVDRFGCAGWTPGSEGVPGAFDIADPTESNCVWVSTDTDGTETLVAVKVPSQEVPTAFAKVIGIDSIAVDAFAVAQIESIRSAHVLPFALKPNPSSNECLGSPPGGLSRDPCSGSTTGNYGYLTSPLHGSTALGTAPTCPPGGLGDKG
ncbi:MAG: Tad domain-containing protein, partial [Actinomycetota bacterium]|nr:Tad domain-containing protein [Actinomycetota bacterium]